MANFKVGLIIQTIASLAGLKATTKGVSELTKVTSASAKPVKALGEAIDYTKRMTPAEVKAIHEMLAAQKAATQTTVALGQAQDQTGRRIVSFAARLRLARIRTVEWRSEMASGFRTSALLGAAGFTWLGANAALAGMWLGRASLAQAKAAKEIRMGAQINGVSTASYQRLNYAVETSVGTGVRLSDVLKNLNSNVIKAARGGKDQKVAFQALGITYMKTARQVQPADVLLGKVADKFATMKDGAKKSALAAMIFGDAGTALIPVLNKGSRGLKDLGDEAERFGLVLSDDAIAKAGGLELQWLRTTRMAKGLRDAVVTALLPSFASLVGWMEKILARDRLKILGNINSGTKALIANLPKITTTLGQLWQILTFVAGAGAGVIKVLGGLSGTFDILSGLFIGRVAFSLIRVAALIWGVNGALWAFPVTWIIAGVAALIFAAVLIVRHWGPIKAFFGGIFSQLKTWFLALPIWAQWLISIPATIVAHWTQITGFFRNLFGGLKHVFHDGTAQIWSGLPPWFKAALTVGAFAVNPVLGAGALALATARPSGPSAPTAAVGARNQLNGTIRVGIDQQGRASITHAETSAPGVGFDLTRGPVLPAF